MPKHSPSPPLFFLIFSLLSTTTTTAQTTTTTTDKQSLLTFITTLPTTPPPLSNWNTTTPLCSFSGVTCLSDRVNKLVLENLNLTGLFPAQLLSLSSLRVLSLKHNSLSGPLPSSLSSLFSLKLLFLSHNRFSGGFPPSLSSLSLLYRLDLAGNSLSGTLSVQKINRMSRLLTLRLEDNYFSGQIGGVRLPDLQDFNVSGNRLAGEIPVSLSAFSATAFSGNVGLCGPPLVACKAAVADPTKPGNESGGAVASNPNPNPSETISSTPSAVPGNVGPKKPGKNGGRAKMGLWAIIAIIVGDVLVLVMISLLLYCYFWKKNGGGNKAGSVISGGEKIVYSSSPYRAGGGVGGGGGGGRMVFLEGVRKFELEDLLRASAEMLGKGVFGTAYKAVLDDGTVVAVKRLKEANVGGGKKEFEQLMEVLGRLKHPNLVPLKAYYFARDEKLLVFDYLPNGSLFWLLHGNRGPGRTPLDWTTRLKVAAGAARGVAFIHSTCRELKLIHGNIKSTNILIDKNGNACVSDFGLSSFAPTLNSSKSNGYRSPEALDGRRLTQKADVYSFGVLLLELLTGKYPSVVEGSGPYGTIEVGGVVDLPRWVQSVVREEWTAEVFDLELMRYKDIEEEMVGLLQIAMACTSASPDQRPRMAQVIKMIEEIRGVEVSPAHENFDSDSPCVSEDTGGVSQ